MILQKELLFIRVLKDIRKLLESAKKPCMYCPQSIRPAHPFVGRNIEYCYLCRESVNLENPIFKDTFAIQKCPCYALGPREAIKRVWVTIDEYLNPEEE